MNKNNYLSCVNCNTKFKDENLLHYHVNTIICKSGGRTSNKTRTINKLSSNKYVIPKSKYAYILLVMKGDNYIPGAIVMAHSLRVTNTNYDIICMVTPDVSKEGIKELNKFMTYTIVEDYLQFKTIILKNKTNLEMYKSWMDVAYTKFQCIKYIQYEKVCFLDADMIVVNNLDHLFTLRYKNNSEVSNAGCFGPKLYKNGKNAPIIYNKNREYGDKITPELINSYLIEGSVVYGHIMIFPTGLDEYNNFCNSIKEKEPFGFINNTCSSDEQAIAYYESIIMKRSWFQLDVRYNVVPWYLNYLKKYDPIYILNYLLLPKPWNLIPDIKKDENYKFEYTDLDIWFQYYRDAGYDVGKDIELCPYCLYFEKAVRIHIKNKKHKFIRNHKIICPSFIKTKQ